MKRAKPRPAYLRWVMQNRRSGRFGAVLTPLVKPRPDTPEAFLLERTKGVFDDPLEENES